MERVLFGVGVLLLLYGILAAVVGSAVLCAWIDGS
jgi:hypothetical protein